MTQREHIEQRAFVAWARMQACSVPALKNLYAVPNGGLRDVRIARKLVAEGVRKGVSDLCLAYPTDRFHGLYLEMKAGKNRPTAAQKEWLERMADAGYGAVVAYGCDAAIQATTDYLAGRLPREVTTYREAS